MMSRTASPRWIRRLLAGEELEQRVVPDSYTWRGHVNDLWANKDNWIVPGALGMVIPASAPTSADDVKFVAMFNKPCVVDGPVEVHSISLEKGYASTIKLKDNITITGVPLPGALAPNSFLAMDNAAGGIVGYTDPSGAITRGTIHLKNNATLIWHSGLLGDLEVKVDNGPGTARAGVAVDEQMGVPAPQMRGVIFTGPGALLKPSTCVRRGA